MHTTEPTAAMLAPEALRTDAVNAALRSVADKRPIRMSFLLKAEIARSLSKNLAAEVLEELIDQQAMAEMNAPDLIMAHIDRNVFGKTVGQLRDLLRLAGLSPA